MRSAITYTIIAGLVVIASAIAINTAIERNGEPAPAPAAEHVDIPSSIKTEHEEIHEALIAATKRTDPVGKAARDLAAVLHPHFVREEQIALPPLGALRALASGTPVDGAATILAMSDSLRAELPRMLVQHVAIRNAVVHMRELAVQAGARDAIGLADALAQHARTEEEVLYPAAVVVGDLLRHEGRH